jgi:UDP-N-acetyl-D-mannosaminuronic acid dehydrogenase
MKIQLSDRQTFHWRVEKIAVIGPGIVGMPMAALLAQARIKIGTEEPAKVVVVQRNSANSGWKVDAINAGRSVIGGIEPHLGAIVRRAVADRLLYATHDYAELADADLILVCIQTDKKENSFEPDYGPLFGGLTSLAKALQNKPAYKIPLIVFESTLAPSTLTTLIREHFQRYGLVEGRDILLGNSPNRVMPGWLVERIAGSDKLAAGLHPETPRMIAEVYRHIVTNADLHLTNSLTAEVVKTLENAYRDVRIAFSTEIARYCDQENIDFYAVRDLVNERLAQADTASSDPNAVPSGGMLIPTVGVGGHCLPKDGILLWWRRAESGTDTNNSLILLARRINDASPDETIRLAERTFGDLRGRRIAILGSAYRFNSEDTRNSPALVLAKQLAELGCQIVLHDPYVKPDDQNLHKYDLQSFFTRSLEEAVADADLLFFTTAHEDYLQDKAVIYRQALKLKGVIDACNLYTPREIKSLKIGYTGIGRGTDTPSQAFVDFVYRGFHAMERGLANELLDIIEFLNERYAGDGFNEVRLEEVQRLAGSCTTGCLIADPAPVREVPVYHDFASLLAICARNQYSLVHQ